MGSPADAADSADSTAADSTDSGTTAQPGQVEGETEGQGAGPAPQAAGGAILEEQRAHLRFDKMFVVRLESLLFGEIYCVARNVSAGGIFVELPDPLPLGAAVRVCFPVPDGSGDVVATGEVKNHYFINYTQGGTNRAVAGMAIRFTSFENEGHHVLADCLSRMRVLH